MKNSGRSVETFHYFWNASKKYIRTAEENRLNEYSDTLRKFAHHILAILAKFSEVHSAKI